MPHVNIQVMSLPEPGLGILGRLTSDYAGSFALLAGGFDAAGCQVSVKEVGENEAQITVFKAGVTEPREELAAEMKRVAEPYLLGLVLRTGIATELDWNSWTAEEADGSRSFGGGGGMLVVKRRQAVRMLGNYDTEAALIESHDELRAALEQCAGSRRLVVENPGASMALAYLAVEGLVTSVLKSATGSLTSAKDWRSAAPLMGSQPDDLHRLLLSTQLGRHVDPKHAKDTLKANGWRPMSDIECAEMALDIVEAYADSLSQTGGPAASSPAIT